MANYSSATQIVWCYKEMKKRLIQLPSLRICTQCGRKSIKIKHKLSTSQTHSVTNNILQKAGTNAQDKIKMCEYLVCSRHFGCADEGDMLTAK